MVRARMRSLLFVLSLVLGLAGAAHAAGQPVYAQIRFSGADAPVIYLRLDQGQLCMATSAEDLKTAKPLQAAPRQMGDGVVSYRPVDLPAKAEGITKATVSLIAQPSPRSPKSGATYLYADFRIQRRDESGATWEYDYGAGGEAKGATTLEKAYVVTVPSWEHYTVGIETKVEKGKVGVGLRVKADGQEVREVKHSGKPVAARFEVRDAHGKLVHKATGDLEKFGFT
jgi:hypothetical protein